LHLIANLSEQIECGEDFRALQFRVRFRQQMAFVAHNPRQLQTGELTDPPGQLPRIGSRPRADAVQAEIDFDDDAAANPALPADVRQRLGLGKMVAGHDRIPPAAHRGNPLQLLLAGDHIGNQHVGNAVVDKDFGLTPLGRGNADGAAASLKMGDQRQLVALHMRTPVLPPGDDELRHRTDVGFHQIEIDAERRGIEFRNMATDHAVFPKKV